MQEQRAAEKAQAEADKLAEREAAKEQKEAEREARQHQREAEAEAKKAQKAAEREAKKAYEETFDDNDDNDVIIPEPEPVKIPKKITRKQAEKLAAKERFTLSGVDDKIRHYQQDRANIKKQYAVGRSRAGRTAKEESCKESRDKSKEKPCKGS